MSKVKYYYDSDTLSYRKIERKKGRRTRIVIFTVLGMLLSGFLLLIIYLNLPMVRTPKELALQRELDNMQLQFELLSKKVNQAQIVLSELEERDNTLYRTYFETNPIPEEQRKAGFGGVNRYQELEGFDNSKLIINIAKNIDILTKQIVVQSKSLDEITELAANKEKLLAAIPAIQPIKNEDMNRMASGYGYRADPFTKAKKFHYGMDFSAPRGTPIYATGEGKVVRADNKASGYGNHVIIDHGYGYQSLYGHLYKYNVKVGQKVKRGDIIGFVGSTGRSSGPHLHYEVFKDDMRMNPMDFYYGSLSAEEYAAMLIQSQQENQSMD
ncbi:MAG TPA: M23 family metallopeptidase [Flavobacteriaceae bacterium]|nr:M23 family metallopeptidase [Flavobacteriaceae bacterium]